MYKTILRLKKSYVASHITDAYCVYLETILSRNQSQSFSSLVSSPNSIRIRNAISISSSSILSSPSLRRSPIQVKKNNNIHRRTLATLEKLNRLNIDTDSDPDSEYEVSRKELERVAKLFKHPKNVLHNISMKVKNHTKKEMLLQHLYHETSNKEWSCINTITWPQGMKFIGYARAKQDASHEAAIKVLHYLLSTASINKKGEPNFYSRVEKKKLLQPEPVNITLSEDFIEEIRNINSDYNERIVPVLEIVKEEEKQRNIRIQEGIEADINIGNWNCDRSEVPSHLIESRNNVLQHRAKNSDQFKTIRESFPIYGHRNEFLELMQNNRVVVIKGEPGCGKSTQIPQYVIEEASLNGRGTECNIIITQPRRISTVSLAHRISEERGERLGDVVGYQIRLKSIMPEKAGGNILFCSTGIALRRIQKDPQLKQCSHIIIDEAHERDADTDTLLLLVKRALQDNPNLKVIVMSATMNAELFTKYFNNCAAMHIPGFTFPVKMNFLDEAKHLNLPKTLQASQMPIPKIFEDEVASVINWIDRNKDPGAILCFLPGWSEIKKVQKYLEELRNPSLQILPAHSKLSTDEQRRIFNRPPEGMRKVILATNICETSITIDDVVYVVDSGMHKDKSMLPSGLQCIDCQWISKASVNQRKGRAGRVQPGESFHLFTKSRYDEMNTYPIPEILRVPLEKIILDSKTYSRGEFAGEFLGELPEPPPRQRIEQAIEELEHMSALDENEELTPLGRRIALFSLPPKLSKALVHSAVFKCVNPLLTISTIFATEIEIFSGFRNDRTERKLIKKKFDKMSDHIAMARLYEAWDSSRRSTYELKVNRDRMAQIKKLREIHAANLYSCGILDRYDFHDDYDADCNEHSKNVELVKAILMSGVDSVLQHHTHNIVRGVVKKVDQVKNEYGQIVNFTSDSVLHGCKEFPSPFMCNISEVHSMETHRSRVNETSMLSPLTVLLFSDTAIESVKDAGSSYDRLNQNNALKIITLFGKRVQLACRDEQIDDLLELRTVIWNIFQYFIARQGKEQNEERWNLMSNYRDGLIIFLGRLLNHVKPDKEA